MKIRSVGPGEPFRSSTFMCSLVTKKGREAEASRPFVCVSLTFLPVDAPDDLADAAARIERRVDVGVGRRHTEDVRSVARVQLVVEVDVVERVQNFEVDFEAPLAREREQLL